MLVLIDMFGIKLWLNIFNVFILLDFLLVQVHHQTICLNEVAKSLTQGGGSLLEIQIVKVGELSLEILYTLFVVVELWRDV